MKDLVLSWSQDEFGTPRQDARLQFLSKDIMCVNARDLAIYEVAPNATSRKDPDVYRADVVGIRHPDALFIETFDPKMVLDLLDRLDHLRSFFEGFTESLPTARDVMRLFDTIGGFEKPTDSTK